MGKNLKYKNFGGSGYRDTCTKHYNMKKRIKEPRFATGEINHNKGAIMSKNDLDKYLMGDKIECLECGHLYKNLSLHIYQRHLMNKKDYCIKYGIPVNTPLAGKALRDKIATYQSKAWDNLSDDKKEEKKIMLNDLSKKTKYIVRDVVCQNCFKQFEAKSAHKHLLCTECRSSSTIEAKIKFKNKLADVDLHCAFCMKKFSSNHPSTHHHKKKGRNVFCSKTCSAMYGANLRSKRPK